MGNNNTTAPGLRVVHVSRGSPAHLAGLEIFFDVVIELDGRTFINGPPFETFTEVVCKCEGRTVKMVVFNSLSSCFRDIWLTPKKWSETTPSLLGMSVRYCVDALKQPPCLHVLEVFPDSPAKTAGLQAERDFLLGSHDIDFQSLDELLDLTAKYIRDMKALKDDTTTTNQPPQQPAGVRIAVYNVKSETTRWISLYPDYLWGGEGCLGCHIAEGILHKLPTPKCPRNGGYQKYVHEDMEIEVPAPLYSNRSSRPSSLSPTGGDGSGAIRQVMSSDGSLSPNPLTMNSFPSHHPPGSPLHSSDQTHNLHNVGGGGGGYPHGMGNGSMFALSSSSSHPAQQQQQHPAAAATINSAVMTQGPAQGNLGTTQYALLQHDTRPGALVCGPSS